MRGATGVLTRDARQATPQETHMREELRSAAAEQI